MEPIHRALGLTDAEAAHITEILGRPANHLELAMYAVMWSEHCSYKSSKIHLRRLPSEAPWVLVGPGEGAGVVDVGDDVAVALRIESHNHPSAIEPYQGAATGVGGILRDVFTMGARPIAVMDPLRFGPLEDHRSRWIFEGVVNGISGYGNSVGVPTVGGEVVFDPCYAGNPLVNVLCVGVMPKEHLILGRASGPGNLAVLIGSSTGRDGIGGVSVLASAGFGGEADAEKRPSVQVGDPFEEKRLIEACLELLEEGLAVGVQDLGGAGLTCATSETASKGGSGMDVYVSQVAQREPGMEPFEVMTSESQERMLAIVTPQNLDRVLELCGRWEVRAQVVGTVTGDGRLRILDRPDGEVLADVPAASLEQDAPVYERPMAPPADLDQRRADDPAALEPPSREEATADLLALLADPSWIYRQYDHQLFLNTVEAPGGDAAVLRLKAPGLPRTSKAIALSTDGTARWCAVDPRVGTQMIVAESALNVACAGATPIALVNCLNFGNPEHPEVMWQLSESVDGMGEACRALKIPVIGGNVSLYNETHGVDIDPTPIVGVLGLIDDLQRRPPGVHLEAGGTLLLLGGHASGLAGSRWAVERRGHRGGSLEPVDLAAHATLIAFVRDLVRAGQVAGLHDVSDGGLGVCLAEMAVQSGVGVTAHVASHAQLFSESGSRVVLCLASAQAAIVSDQAAAVGIACEVIGEAGGERIVLGELVDVGVDEARTAWTDSIPAALIEA
ncbi:MAG TPA: phosphoribosylformylglycinamidine synthase subunit PurL [Acidimicrobiales bacterium]|nr:phosphoribosylformylglycinamidine synthase subunit PurL [Acidimicrobiales bacterium]